MQALIIKHSQRVLWLTASTLLLVLLCVWGLTHPDNAAGNTYIEKNGFYRIDDPQVLSLYMERFGDTLEPEVWTSLSEYSQVSAILHPISSVEQDFSSAYYTFIHNNERFFLWVPPRLFMEVLAVLAGTVISLYFVCVTLLGLVQDARRENKQWQH
ncbi:MAG: hypothetical protein GY814_13955 [Gammaproteobacteria bacterium]|nr:hypothetical protein [Gammaproteobacteria bacterium]